MENEILEGYRKRDPETGLIFPWYTWPCLEWLKGLDLKGKTIFEYGLGDSTLWFTVKGAISCGVDHNLGYVPPRKGNHYMVALSKEFYVKVINRYVEKFDIVVIDGIHRDECTQPALSKLNDGGYLIIDNYHQPSVEPNIWTQTDKLIEGMPITIYKQPGHDDWQTAVITKP